MSLLPAALLDVHRGGPQRRQKQVLQPPIGASPGELRLWLKQHGELDQGKAAEEARIRAKNSRRESYSSGLVAVPSDGVVKSGRRAGQRPEQHIDPTAAPAKPAAHNLEETVKLRQALSERSAALKASEAHVAGLEARLAAMAAELEAARAETEKQSASACALQEQLAAQAKAEQARTAAMGERMNEITQGWQKEQQAFALYKARHPEGDVPPEEAGLPLEPAPPAAAATEEEAMEASGEVYSEDEVEEEEEEE